MSRASAVAAPRLAPRLTRAQAGIALAVAALALVGWHGVTTVGPGGGIDSDAYARYAQYLYENHRLPPWEPLPEAWRNGTYEYQAPPLYEVLGALAEGLVNNLPSRRLEPGNLLVTGILWLALFGGGILALTAARPGLRRAGLAAVALAALWGLNQAVALGKEQPWAAGRLLSLAALLGVAVVTALIAREVWPDRPRRMLGASAILLAYPVAYRLGVLFHPELLFVLCTAVAVLLFLRAGRSGWPAALGAGAGVACGLGALTRQSAVVPIFCVLVGAAVAGRSRAVAFVAAAVAAIVLVAGPWWGYAYHTWGNPLEGNLDRPGHLLEDGQPLSFFVSFPIRSLVLHPYRPDFAGELLPQLHADLWSDWFGAIHDGWWRQPRLAIVTASTQSVLGLVAGALGIVGLARFGVPAAWRALRGRAREDGRDLPFAFLALLAAAALGAFVLQLLRYPQIDGDQIKSSYVFFAAPAWAVFTVSAWTGATARSSAARVLLPAWAVLYALSYGAATLALFL